MRIPAEPRAELSVSVLQDLKDSVTRIAHFLEKPLEAEVMEKIADRCLFKNMKKNKMSNYSLVPQEFMDQTKSEFLRKGAFDSLFGCRVLHHVIWFLFSCPSGIVGDWKNQLTAEQSENFDAVYKDKMKDVKYKFAWDLQ